MKSFIYLLLLAGLAFGVYVYYPQIQEFIEYKKSGKNAPAVAEASIPPPAEKLPEPPPEPEVPETTDLEAELEKAMAREDPAPAKPPVLEFPDYSEELAKKFPMPKIKTLEEAVGNWKRIPKNALPQTVVINAPVEMSLPNGVGKSTAPAGTQVVAIAANSTGLLAVAPNEGSKVRGRVKMDDTNFKEVVKEVYDDFVTRKEQEVFAKREAERRKLLAKDRMAQQGVTEGFEIIGPKPDTDGSGRVAAMVESIKRGDVTEFTLAKVDSWTPVLFDTVEGEPYWSASVKYKASTIFGTFDAEAVALMRKGRVERWVYAGSGEPVP